MLLSKAADSLFSGGGLPLLWSPKTITLLWLSGVCEGYPCPDCFFFAFVLARFNKEFAVSGLGMVFKFLRYTIFSLLLKEIQSWQNSFLKKKVQSHLRRKQSFSLNFPSFGVHLKLRRRPSQRLSMFNCPTSGPTRANHSLRLRQ